MLIVLYYGHENAPVLEKNLEYEDLREENKLNIHSVTDNTAWISRIIGANSKRIGKRVECGLSDAEHAY